MTKRSPTQGGCGGGGGSSGSSMESANWRTRLQPDCRQKIIRKIYLHPVNLINKCSHTIRKETLKRHHPPPQPELLQELDSLAVRFEERIYAAAKSEFEYKRRIALKMLAMESSLLSSSAGKNVNPSNTGSQGMQHVNYQGQSLPIPVPSNHPQTDQQLLSRSMHDDIASSGVQASSGLSSALPHSSCLTQPTKSNVAGQNSGLQDIQNITGFQQTSVGTMKQTLPPNNFANQRQMLGKQLCASQEQQQQQSQKSRLFLYQQQLHQIEKQKLQQNNVTPSVTQSRIQKQQQQQNLLQPCHLQSSQQSVMQPTLMPTSLSSVRHNQQPFFSQSKESELQQHKKSVHSRQKQQLQASIVCQQKVMPTQQHQLPRPNPVGQQESTTNMPQNHLIGQRSSYSDMQQQRRLLGLHSNVSNVQQSHQQDTLFGMDEQCLGSQSSPGGQRHWLGTKSANSSTLNNQHSVHKFKIPIHQHNQQDSSTLLPKQGQQLKPLLQQQGMAQLQSQPGQLQKSNMQLQPNLLQQDMQQSLPTSGAFREHNVIDQQEQLFQQRRVMPEASYSGMGTLQPNSNMLPHHYIKQEQVLEAQQLKPNSNMFPHQYIQQEQVLEPQQLEPFYNRPMQQQFLHDQPLWQQPQPQPQQQQQQQKKQKQQLLHRQTKWKQSNHQLLANQLPQLHQMSVANDMKLKQQTSVKPGAFEQHHTPAQRSFYHEQLKSGASFSPQLLPASWPQIPRHPSWQKDLQTLMDSLTKASIPVQSTNSPLITPSPSTASTSAVPEKSESINSGVPLLCNAGNIGHQQPTAVVLPAQSLGVRTTGIPASPLFAEFTSPEGHHGNVESFISTWSGKQPIERLGKVVTSISSKALSASIIDIGSVVSMTDRISGSPPGDGSRAAVGEDLLAMPNCRLQARTFVTQDGTTGARKRKRFTTAMALNIVSSAGSITDSFKLAVCAKASNLESTATSTIKRPSIETNHALLEEIKEINQGLINTVMDISEENVDPASAGAVSEGEGTIVKCSFNAVALSPNLRSQYASTQMSPIQPLRLLVPANYPNCSPILLDRFPIEVSKEYGDLPEKLKSRLRSLSQPMSLREIARTWDVCARSVISDYAQQRGGGTFSARYGTWENCLSGA